MTHIAIVGGGLAGKLAALYFDRHLPDASITIIDPETPGLPVVGESTVEVTTQFLTSLGLGPYMEEQHLHKYGLTYYFRLPGQDGNTMAPHYVRHESPGVKRLLAFNLNRHSFDAELARRLPARATRIAGTVDGIDFAGGAPVMEMMDKPKRRRMPRRVRGEITPGTVPGPQVIRVITNSGETREIRADHVIDCSGRGRMLAKQLGLQKAPPYQRCSYWFRLAGFDRRILMDMPVVKDSQHSFDSYYVTHHFYGKGYWIWIIPMKSETGEDMASIGITYRPEVSGEKAMNMARLLDLLGRDHPKIVELIHSGRKVDESRYFNYMYEASQYYDRKGRWFMVGDSAFTFDPANSAGIAYLANQIPQITAMILKSQAGQLSEDYVDALETHVKAQLALQDEWTHWYEIMDDPVKMAWLLVISNMGYFTFPLPNYLTGAFLNAGVARQVGRVFKRADDKMMDDKMMMAPKVYPFPKVLDRLADTKDPQEIIRRTPSMFDEAVPFSYFRPEDVNRGRLIARYLWKTAKMRNRALWLLQWWKDPGCWAMAAGQYGRSALNLAGAAILTLRPQLWDLPMTKDPALASPFDPPQSFLYPDGAQMAATQGGKVTTPEVAAPAPVPEPELQMS